MDQYSQLISRNWAFINAPLQKKIKNTKLLIAGCGLGSQIAVLAARTGFQRFILVDGDTVSLSNLNRQAFYLDDLEKNKAIITADRLKKINPEVKLEIVRENISFKKCVDFVKRSDFVINTVDFDVVYYKLISEAQSQSKVALMPLNIGFGGMLLAFNEMSLSLDQIIGMETFNNDRSFYIALLQNIQKYSLPAYISAKLESILTKIQSTGINPQIGIAALVTSALVVTTVIKFLDQKPVILAPVPISCDLYEP